MNLLDEVEKIKQDVLRRTWTWILLNIPYQKNLYAHLLQN